MRTQTMVSFIVMTCKQCPSDPTEQSFAPTVFQAKVSFTYSTISKILESLASVTVHRLYALSAGDGWSTSLTVVHVFYKHHVNNQKDDCTVGQSVSVHLSVPLMVMCPKRSLYRSVRSIGMFVCLCLGPITVNLGSAAWNCAVVVTR